MKITDAIKEAIESYVGQKCNTKRKLAAEIGIGESAVGKWLSGEITTIRLGNWRKLERLIRPWLPEELRCGPLVDIVPPTTTDESSKDAIIRELQFQLDNERLQRQLDKERAENSELRAEIKDLKRQLSEQNARCQPEIVDAREHGLMTDRGDPYDFRRGGKQPEGSQEPCTHASR